MTVQSAMRVRRWGTTMGQAALWSHQTVLAAEPSSAAKARAFVLKHLVEHRLLYLVDDIRLVASEFAANAVVHARTTFTVTLEGHVRSVLLTVRDESRAAPMLADEPPDGLQTRGRGLAIVNLISESWGVTASPGDAKSVWASFDIRSRPVV
jgi:anti-sigma regulatory factor (Ser/Thr protein kinase)